MSAPASEEVRELERLLVIAAEQGQARSFASLREELAMGHGELEAALDVLREHGKAVEVAPGEWVGPEMDAAPLAPHEALDGDGRVVVSVPPASADENGAAPAPAPLAQEASWSGVTWEPTVRLTMAIAHALDAAAIGQLIKAGIDDAQSRGETFVLEVLP